MQKTTHIDERGQAVKMPNWFSWRHRTRDEHEAAVARYLADHGPDARAHKASERERRNIVIDCGHCQRRHCVDRDCYQVVSA